MNRKDVFDLLSGILILSMVLAGCFGGETIPDPRAQNPQATPPKIGTFTTQRLRIKNAGVEDITNLTVIFPESQVHFGDVPAGATTVYQPVPNGVYNYAAYDFEVNGKQVQQPVIDWMGEVPRAGQSFTYEIDFDPGRSSMQMIRLIKVLDE